MKGISTVDSCNKNVGTRNSTTIKTESDLLTATSEMLVDARTKPTENNVISLPVSQLSTLGAGVSSLIPKFRTITQTTSINCKKFYKLANAVVGDKLKEAKNGEKYGAIKTADGKSKMARFKPVNSVTKTSKTVTPVDPTILMMAVALYSIEQQLSNIVDMQKQILSFLELETEAEIEADLETLTDIITKYKHNWDNKQFVMSNHKMVVDIQRTARKNMNLYQKRVSDFLKNKQSFVSQSKIKTILQTLLIKFKYYRLALYAFSMASMAEIMLGGNYKEEYICGVMADVESLSMAYRDIYAQCSSKIEKMGASSLEVSVLKGIGTASKSIGKIIGDIPKIKKGKIDEFFCDSGNKIGKNAVDIEKNAVKAFAEISNPCTGVFLEKMRDIVQIFNHTKEMRFDKEQICLITD